MDGIARKLNITSKEDWSKINTNTLKLHGAGTLLRFYNGSPIKLLTTIYPEYKWNIHDWNQVPRGHWDNMDNQRAFVDDIGKKLSITNKEEWYNVKFQDFLDHGGAGLLNRKYKGSVCKLLTTIYPEYQQCIVFYSSFG